MASKSSSKARASTHGNRKGGTVMSRGSTKPALEPSRGRLRFALVGAGHIAQAAVLPAFANASTRCELTAIISDDETKRRALGRRYAVTNLHGYDEFDSACRSGNFDAVYIALPNDLHREYTVRAARAGIHVLCEKPMADNAADCRAMIKACKDADVRLMIAYRLHFERANMRAVQVARSGRLGDLRMFNAVFSMQVKKENIRTDRERGGGPLWDIGVYCLNAARYIFRDEPLEVTAFNAKSSDPRFKEVEEACGVVLRFPGERLATILCSFGAADTGYYQIVGTRGDLCVDPAYEYHGDGLGHTLTIGDRTTEQEYPTRDQFAPELIYFADCVRRGRDPEPGGAEGMNDVLVIEAIKESARKGKAVTVKGLARDRHPDLRQERRRKAVKKVKLVKVAAAHA